MSDKNLNNIVTFLAGSIFGSVVTYYITKKYFSKKHEEDLLTAEERGYRNAVNDKTIADEIIEKHGYLAREDFGIPDPSLLEGLDVAPPNENDEPAALPSENPYVIDIMEYGEMDDYDEINLTLYADGVITDENDDIIENPEELIGKDNYEYLKSDGLTINGETMFIRNDIRKCDYEVVASYMSYHDIVEDYPNLMLHGEEEYED